jgi:hypothetical protein
MLSSHTALLRRVSSGTLTTCLPPKARRRNHHHSSRSLVVNFANVRKIDAALT